MVKCGWLMGKLVRRKRLGGLGLNSKGIDVLKVMSSERMMIEAMKVGDMCSVTSMDPAFRGRQRKWCSETKAEAGRVQVSSLAMIERVGTTGRRSVVSRWLVCE